VIGSNSRSAVEICSAIPCTFEQNSCSYNLKPPDASRSFAIQRGPVGNPLTGITRDRVGKRDWNEAFLMANGERDGSDDRFEAESAPFVLSSAKRIRFYRHQGSSGSRLRVCLGSASNCLRTYDEVSREWHEETLVISPRDLKSSGGSTTTLLFIADGLTQTSYVGLDEIDVLDANQSNSIC